MAVDSFVAMLVSASQQQSSHRPAQQQQQQMQLQQQMQGQQMNQAGAGEISPATAGRAQQRQQQPMEAVIQELLTTLRSPSSDQQKTQHVMNILQSNLELMDAFLRQRSAQDTLALDFGGADGAVTGGAGGDFNGSGDASTSATTSPGESRRLSIQRCIQSLVHACQCRDANCRLPSCHKMKRVVQHAKSCKRKANRGGSREQGAKVAGCPICKQLIALCCYHAKHCTEQKCPVSYCVNIKHKLRQQQLQQRLQQQHILRRRIATMTRISQQSQQSRPQHLQSLSPQQPTVSLTVTENF